MVAVVVGLHWFVLAQDLKPLGPSCGFEDDPGSGWSGAGHEEIEWGRTPESLCISASGAVYRGAAVHLAYARSFVRWVGFPLFPVAVILCPPVGIVMVDRRLSERDSMRTL